MLSGKIAQLQKKRKQELKEEQKELKEQEQRYGQSIQCSPVPSQPKESHRRPSAIINPKCTKSMVIGSLTSIP